MSSKREGKYIGNTPLFSNDSLEVNLPGTWCLDQINSKSENGDWEGGRYQIQGGSITGYSPILGELNTTVMAGYYIRSDGLKLYSLEDAAIVYQYSILTAWDLSTTSSDLVTLDTRNECRSARGVFFKPDGLKLYVVGASQGNYGGVECIFQYNLSTAWDISTATYGGFFNLSSVGGVTEVQDIFVRADSSRFYVVCNGTDRVVEYSFSSGNVSTASSTGITTTITASENTPTGLFFRPDGLKMYTAGHQVGVREYDLRTAWDLRTATGVTTVFGGVISSPYAISFKPDGTKMFVSDSSFGGRFREFITESKPWVVGIASTTQRLHNPAGSIHDLKFSPDGSKVFGVMNSKRAVFSADLATNWSVNSAIPASLRYFTGLTTDFPSESLPRGVCFNSNGTRMFINGSATDTIYQYNIGTAWNISAGVSFGTSRAYALGPTVDVRSCKFRDDGLKFYTAETVTDTVLQYGLTTAFNVTSMNYEGKALVPDLLLEETVVSAFDFDPTGKIVSVGGESKGGATQYNLINAWDVSRSVPAHTLANQNTYNSNISGQQKSRTAFTFKPDGTKLFVGSYELISEYHLSEPFNLATAYPNGESFNINEVGGNLQDIRFKPDGSAMFVVDNIYGVIGQYNLEVPWKVRSAGFVTSFVFRPIDSNPVDLEFKPDGTKMFVLGFTNDRVYEFNLTTAWNVSTASTVTNYSVTSQEAQPIAMTFSNDGSRMYISGYNEEQVFTYNLASPWSLGSVGVGTSVGNYVSRLRTDMFASDALSMYMSPDGLKFFYITDDLYLQSFALTEPYNVQTARYVGLQTGLYYTYRSGQLTLSGLAYGDDGKRLYMSGYSWSSNNMIREFKL